MPDSVWNWYGNQHDNDYTELLMLDYGLVKEAHKNNLARKNESKWKSPEEVLTAINADHDFHKRRRVYDPEYT
jgi:hypothetical protein